MTKDLVFLLPFELWDKIFSYLSPATVRQLTKLHPIFLHAAASLLWRNLTLCSVTATDTFQLKSLLLTPTLARLVRNVRIATWALDAREFDLLFQVAPPTPPSRKPRFLQFFSSNKKRGKRNSHIVQNSNGRSPTLLSKSSSPITVLNDALAVLPLLTNMSCLEVNLLFHHADRKPYEHLSPLWKSLGFIADFEHLHCLRLSFASHSVPIMASWLSDAAPSLQRVSDVELTLQSWVAANTHGIEPSKIFDPFRKTLRRLFISFLNSAGVQDMSFLEKIGRFPCLLRFDYDWSHWNAHLGRAYQKFVCAHRRTIKELFLVSISPASISSCSFFNEDGFDPTFIRPMIEYVNVKFTPSRGHTLERTFLPSFLPFASTLTALSISAVAYSFKEIESIIEGLNLIKVQVTTTTLKPRLLMLFFVQLPDIRVLDISYQQLYKPLEYPNEHLSHQEKFWENINPRIHFNRMSRLDVRATNDQLGVIPVKESYDQQFRMGFKRIVNDKCQIGAIDWQISQE